MNAENEFSIDMQSELNRLIKEGDVNKREAYSLLVARELRYLIEQIESGRAGVFAYKANIRKLTDHDDMKITIKCSLRRDVLKRE